MAVLFKQMSDVDVFSADWFADVQMFLRFVSAFSFEFSVFVLNI